MLITTGDKSTCLILLMALINNSHAAIQQILVIDACKPGISNMVHWL